MDPNGPALLQLTKNAFNAVLHLSKFVEQLSRKRSVAAWGSLTALFGSLLWCLEMAISTWTQSREGHAFLVNVVLFLCFPNTLIQSMWSTTCVDFKCPVLVHSGLVRLWLAFSLLASNAGNEPWTIVKPYKCGCPWRFTQFTCLNTEAPTPKLSPPHCHVQTVWFYPLSNIEPRKTHLWFQREGFELAPFSYWALQAPGHEKPTATLGVMHAKWQPQIGIHCTNGWMSE